MFWYIIFVTEDGMSHTIPCMSEGNASDMFNVIVRKPGVVYAHYAEVMGKPIDSFAPIVADRVEKQMKVDWDLND